MPDYTVLKKMEIEKRKRTISGIKSMRSGFSEAESKIPAKTSNETLLLATWNIREFDSAKYGPRDDECFCYIAEIVSRFDIVAIQEVRDSLYALQRLKRLLGSWWDYLVTDVTIGKSGNSERMAFLFDRRKVDFTGLAAELVLPKSPDETEIVQFARSPYVSGFKAGWAYFTLVTFHIYYGKDDPVDPRRLQEITDIGKIIAKNAPAFSGAAVREPGKAADRDNLIVLGDFNIFNKTDVTLEALIAAGFLVPDALQVLPGSNAKQDKHYDQIAYFKKLSGLKPTGNAGIFNYYKHVYRDDQEDEYQNERREKPGRSYKDWRTYKMSDHLPMWVEFNIDDSEAYLDKLASQ